MERIAYQALLYDFYGELLTEHQKSIFEEYCLNDLSLSEIGEEHHISRQGAHDIVKRCNKILEGYEEKLQLIAKFDQTKQDVLEIGDIAKSMLSSHNEEALQSSVDRLLLKVQKVISEL